MRTEFIGAEGYVLLDTVRRLYRRQAKGALGKALSKIHPGELAWIFRHLTTRQRREIFQVIHKFENVGDIISEMDHSIQIELLTPLDSTTLSEVITGMPPDDQADLLDEFPDELRVQVLENMKKEDAAEVAEDSASVAQSVQLLLKHQAVILTKDNRPIGFVTRHDIITFTDDK